MAIVLSVISKPDSNDTATHSHPVISSYETLLDKKNLSGIKFAFVKSGASINTFKDPPIEINRLYETFFNQLRQLGGTITDIDLDEFNADRQNNKAGEIQQINQYLASFPSTRQSFKDICQSNRTQIFKGIKGCLQPEKETASLNNPAYQKAVDLFAKNRNYVTNIMTKNNLDALIVPIATHGKATYDEKSVNTWQIPISSNAGLPAITVNIGYTHDKIKMPVGIEIIGKFQDETLLLQIASLIEKNSPPRRLPNLKTSTNNNNLVQLNIAEFNNLLTTIGEKTYSGFLKFSHPKKLTPIRFNQFIEKSVEQFTKTKRNILNQPTQ